MNPGRPSLSGRFGVSPWQIGRLRHGLALWSSVDKPDGRLPLTDRVALQAGVRAPPPSTASMSSSKLLAPMRKRVVVTAPSPKISRTRPM